MPLAQSDKITHTTDSGYTVPMYIAPLIDEFDNLLLISRMRYGIKVYKAYTGTQFAKAQRPIFNLRQSRKFERRGGRGF